MTCFVLVLALHCHLIKEKKIRNNLQKVPSKLTDAAYAVSSRAQPLVSPSPVVALLRGVAGPGEVAGAVADVVGEADHVKGVF